MKRILMMVPLILVCWLSASCAVPFQSLTVDRERRSLPSGNYMDISWFTPNRIALTHSDSPDRLALEKYQLMVYTLDTQVGKVVAIPELEQCQVTWTIRVWQLPNQDLAIARLCRFLTEHASNRFTDILSYDAEVESFEELMRLPLGKDVTSFSFTPDLSHSLQTFDSTGGLLGQVVRVDQTGEVEPLFETFSRARDATFSPSGDAFAFLGTEVVPKVDGGLFGWQASYRQQLAHPWTLYVVEGRDAEPQPVVENIRYGRYAQWSPTGPYIAFAGEVQAFDGVWVVHLTTGKVYRLWKETDPFDWSPDGQQMIILDTSSRESSEGTPPQMVLLSLSLPE